MTVVKTNVMNIFVRVRSAFRSREIYVHDGAALKRVHLSPVAQIAGASAAGVALVGLAIAGVSLFSGASVAAVSLANVGGQHYQTAKMESRVTELQSEVAAIRAQAQQHAAALDQRDALLSAMIAGTGNEKKISSLEALDVPRAKTQLDSSVRAPLTAVEHKQLALADQVRVLLDQRISKAEATFGHLGLADARFHKVTGGMGGPFEPVDEKATAAGEQNFRSLLQSWKKLDQIQQTAAAIPSIKPVDSMSYTSTFGVRVDPFNGRRAMHAGVDMPGSMGTNIYATADGIVNRAGWVNGYGNLVELDHGHGIMTRYGHLSSFVVAAGQHVHRGELIAHMGSTGRSTGTHLHYEVRIDGTAVNPMPFLQSSDYLTALQKNPAPAKAAMGGPEVAE